ncbi:MAG TPA: hypothetical protein DCM08_12370 [Microscillaceae bacterium]|nr:hypothetical protein [Microscillaceae bacterium]
MNWLSYFFIKIRTKSISAPVFLIQKLFDYLPTATFNQRSKLFYLAGGLFLSLALSDVSAQVTKDSTQVLKDSVSAKEIGKIEVQDTLFAPAQKKFIPRKAALFAAVLPGLGQIYNRKYWKLPIVYGAAGLLVFLAIDANQAFLSLRESYFAKTQPNSGRIDQFPGLTAATLVPNFQSARRDRDFYIILAGAIYALQIVDALVDAHLKGFDLSDNLSLHIKPSFQTAAFSQPVVGIKLALSFK